MLSLRRFYTTLVLELSYESLAARLCSVAVLLWISCVSCLSLCVHFTVTVCACARPFVSVYQQDLNGEKGTQSKSKVKRRALLQRQSPLYHLTVELGSTLSADLSYVPPTAFFDSKFLQHWFWCQPYRTLSFEPIFYIRFFVLFYKKENVFKSSYFRKVCLAPHIKD